jgi:uncharacterized phage protein gp47/JayE
MPWETPTLRDVRTMVRDLVRGSLPGADAAIPNSVLRVLSDNQGALCHLTLQYIDWLALQLLPDTAETEWLDRHGDIWLVNADNTTGRKMATLAEGIINIVGLVGGIIVPSNSRLSISKEGGVVEYETMEEIVTAPDTVPVQCPIRAIDPGALGNLEQGDTLAFVPAIDNITTATAASVGGGTDTENDDDLRVRVLERIRQPPQGGAAHDYIRWAKAVPGCTRAWCAPLEMGIGTVTVRVLFDELRADDDGWPTDQDLKSVEAYIDTVRPVAVKDFWVVAPVKQFIEVHIVNLVPDTTEVRAAIEVSLQEMLYTLAAPGQTIFAVWKAHAIMETANVVSFDLTNWLDDIMQSPGHMAVLGDIVYDI